MIPKPPKRIRDKDACAQFAEANPRCHICGATGYPFGLQIHHMGDLPDVHRRSDVPENMLMLCSDCHIVKFHSEARWTKEQLREMKDEQT